MRRPKDGKDSNQRSVREILVRQQQPNLFVGREDQLCFFRENLQREPGDPHWRMVVNVYGQGGVGKSSLLRRFRDLAREAKALTAWTDENEKDLPAVLGWLAEQLEQQGHELKHFAERYRVYRQRRQELEADPEAPQGFAPLIGRLVVKGSFTLAKTTPVGSVITSLVDEESCARLGEDLSSFVVRKVGNKDEVHLLLDPVAVLTPLFLEDLWGVTEKHRVALFFDTYEATAPFLDEWLRDLLDGRYGDLSSTTMWGVAGREALDARDWSPYEGLLIRYSLEPFNEEEARAFLAGQGIVQMEMIETILRLSGRLPLLVATLAKGNPKDPFQIGDPSEEAVKCFLKWEPDLRRRQVALNAALPRILNRDVLATWVPAEAVESSFTWLKTMPFIQHKRDGRVYHEIVRTQMLYHKRHESPKEWAELHGKLAGYYRRLQESLGLTEAAQRRDETWQAYALEELYHQLCQSPQHLEPALNGFVAALKSQKNFARRWGEVLTQSGRDTGATGLVKWGEQMQEGLEAYEQDRYGPAIELFSALLKRETLAPIWQAAALDWRGHLYRLDNRIDLALLDFDRAIALQAENPEFLIDRGIAYLQQGLLDKTLADFDRALELDDKAARVYVMRGLVYQLLKRHDEALADFDRALALDEGLSQAFVGRGEILFSQERYDEALIDFNRAIALDEKSTSALIGRGEILLLKAHYEEALADFDRLIGLDEGAVGAIVTRGLIYRALGRYPEALADFDRAIALNAEYGWAIFQRGKTYRLQDRYGEALADFERVIALDETYAPAIAGRGQIYLDLERYAEALADFDRAIALDEMNAGAIAHRGQVYRALERYDDALRDLDRALALDEKLTWAYAERGEVYRLQGRYPEALVEFDQVIQMGLAYAGIIASRGCVYRELERYEEALADFDRAIALDESYAWAIARRGQVYQALGRYSEALADFDRAIALDESLAWAIARRGEVYRLQKRYSEALADFDRAIALDESLAWAIILRGQVYQALERYDEALADFDRAFQIGPENDWVRYQRAMICRRLDREAEARRELAEAIRLAALKYEADPRNWQNTFNLALYYLAAGETARAEGLYQGALAAPAPAERVEEARRDLRDFLALFPDHAPARAMAARLDLLL